MLEKAYLREKNQLDSHSIEQQILKELGLRQILDIPALQSIQDRISKVAGLSLVTVDVKGIPITKETSFCDYCIARRTTEMGKKACFFSDAYGGLRASMTNEPYIYYCPAGLTDCAIPIVVEDQYIGAILMGQVRTDKNYDIDDLSQVIREKMSPEEEHQLMELYYKVPVMEMEKLKLTGDLALYMVKLMIEKQLVKLVQKEIEAENQKLVYENFVQSVEMDSLKNSEKQSLRDELKPQMMMSLLNSINNLSMIEGADLTNELICLFADTIRHSFNQNKEYVSLKKELENIQRFLEIQRICTNESFEYTIQVNCDIAYKEILSLVLLPFVENAITHGILMKTDKSGHISIRVEEEEKDYLIEIADDGQGIQPEILKKMLSKEMLTFEEDLHYNGLSIANTRKRLVTHYGQEYDISIVNKPFTQGCCVTIRIPIEKNRKD